MKIRSLFLCLLAGPSLLAGKLPEGYTPILLAAEASPAVEAAARDLAGLMARSFGERPRLRREPLLGLGKGLRIGPAPRHPALDADPLTDEVLVERSGRGLGIHGADNSATVMAVYRFAEVFLGWRYYQPGPLGFERLDHPPDFPQASGEPAILLLETPSFQSRRLSGIQPRGMAAGWPDWQRWHGMRERYQYNHSVHRVVPPQLFEEHPEWFAKGRDGLPKRPPFPEVNGYNDHPDLRSGALRDWVAGQALASLAEKTPLLLPEDFEAPPPPPGRGTRQRVRPSPGLLSLSLSLGDSYIFGSFPDGYRARPEGFFRRWPDWSPHVFRYSNAVAERILEVYRRSRWAAPEPRPQLRFGCLSYLVWENVPDVDVHPSIVPWLTFDRSQWHDPAARADDLALLREWSAKSEHPPGTWDYLFGYGFMIPRSLSGIVRESIPALHEAGIDSYYSQIGAIWPFDGHTNWLTVKLLWSHRADGEELLEEYYREFFGPAAEPMRRFHDIAEKAWMEQEGPSWWLRYWKDPYHVHLLPPGLRGEMRALLEEASLLARTRPPRPEPGLASGRFRERVEGVSSTFALTEAFAGYMEAVFSLQTGMQSLRRGEAIPFPALLSKAARVLSLRSELLEATSRYGEEPPPRARAPDLSWVFRYDSAGGAIADLVRRAPTAALRERAATLFERWNRLRGGPVFSPARDGRFEEILYDNDFSEIEDRRIWQRQFLPSEDLSLRPLPETGAFEVENARRGHLYQLFRIEPGEAYLGELVVTTRQSASGQVALVIDFLDANMEPLESGFPRARILPPGHGPARQSLTVVSRPPEEAVYGRLLIRFHELDPGRPANLHATRVWALPVEPVP